MTNTIVFIHGMFENAQSWAAWQQPGWAEVAAYAGQWLRETVPARR
jgi:hypothetical protein